MTANIVSQSFEKSFISQPLSRQIALCEHYELADYFLKHLPAHQPILEAGCGSGRWVAWFVNHGLSATGLDWSLALCERARTEISGVRFIQGDMRQMPFQNEEFGSIVSLGAVEHSFEGPALALREYYRVLRPGGVAIITVPFVSPIRFISKGTKELAKLLLAWFSPRLRAYQRYKTAHKGRWVTDYLLDDKGEWSFFQYQFRAPEMRTCLTDEGFVVVQEFVDFVDEGILHNFGSIAGKYDTEHGRVQFTIAGAVLRKLLPAQWVGHMLCYLVSKP